MSAGASDVSSISTGHSSAGSSKTTSTFWREGAQTRKCTPPETTSAPTERRRCFRVLIGAERNAEDVPKGHACNLRSFVLSSSLHDLPPSPPRPLRPRAGAQRRRDAGDVPGAGHGRGAVDALRSQVPGVAGGRRLGGGVLWNPAGPARRSLSLSRRLAGRPPGPAGVADPVRAA